MYRVHCRKLARELFQESRLHERYPLPKKTAKRLIIQATTGSSQLLLHCPRRPLHGAHAAGSLDWSSPSWSTHLLDPFVITKATHCFPLHASGNSTGADFFCAYCAFRSLKTSGCSIWAFSYNSVSNGFWTDALTSPPSGGKDEHGASTIAWPFTPRQVVPRLKYPSE